MFFPYYQCGDKERQKEIDLCLQKNISNAFISKLIVLIDDKSLLPFQDPKITVLYLESRPTYKKWIELTKDLSLSGVSVLCNSDIYFDDSVRFFTETLDVSLKFLALSRWELTKGESPHLHPNPRWSQDVWAMNCDNYLSKEMLHQLDFPMGVPRCDNKIAYVFCVFGWQVFNPCAQIKSFHAHETGLRTYHKKLDIRIIGGVAYVPPSEALNEPSQLQIEVWVKSSENIKSATLSRTLERWFAEEKVKELEGDTKLQSVDFVGCDSHALLQAIKSGQSLKRLGPNFEMFQSNGQYIFKNAFALKSTVKTNTDVSESVGLDQLFAYGLIPPVLTSFVGEISTKAKDEKDLNFWQYPCATEKQAYENHLNINHGKHISLQSGIVHIYVPLPWATYIDRKSYPEGYLQKIGALLRHYRDIAVKAGLNLKVHSVCQHIHWIRILEKAQQLGITDIHLSHKDSKTQQKQHEAGYKFNLHGYPLIAVNYVIPERSQGMERKAPRDKKLLASFIGAHMPHYLDSSRLKLFEAAKESGRKDVFVDLGNEWHFNKIVYEEQVLNRAMTANHLDEHDKKTFNYNTILSDSVFSLCPIGAGPNTLRFWESIAVGSIPVLFSDDLAVLHECDLGVELRESCVIWEKEVGPELFDYLGSFEESEIASKSLAKIELFERFNKKNVFGALEEKILKPLELNIIYVGASVTAQKNGYRPSLNELLKERGLVVHEKVMATGATGSMFGLCNLSTLVDVDEKYDLAIYEYSTGDLNRGLTPESEISNVVKESLEYLKSIAENVVMIHNYRSDYEGEKGDFIRKKYDLAAEELSIPIIDNTKYFENLRQKVKPDEWPQYYRDNVHSGDKGSNMTAALILERLDELFDFSSSDQALSEPYSLRSGFTELNLKSSERGIYTYPSSNQQFPFILLNSSQELIFKCKGEFWGIVSIVGPTSGWVEVRANGQVIQKFCQLDTHCYYDRVQPRQFLRNFKEETEIVICLTDGELDFGKVKQKHKLHEQNRLLKMSFVMGRDMEVSDEKILTKEVSL